MSQKIFRHTPHRAADAMKIIVGNKTNATIRDLEETEEDIEEIEGVVVSIDKDKINGDGWVVKDAEGNTYTCNCASDMYQLPETEEYGGVYYPTKTVSVKITKNPILRNNTITEFTSLGKNEDKLDISKWKHGDKATTVIAKPMSAISISNALISFNYNNTNAVKADDESVKTEGKKTTIDTKSLVVNSSDIYLADETLEDYVNRTAYEKIATQYQPAVSNVDNGIDAMRQNNLGQLNINVKTYVPNKKQKIITDLKDPSMAPEHMQKHPLLAGNDIDELYIYPNGLVTIQARGVPNKKEIFNSLNWITSQYTKKYILTIQVKTACDCCNKNKTGSIEYFNYCPICKTFTTLSETYDGYITCSSCHTLWCEGCGHPRNMECSNKTYNLKKYPDNAITAVGMSCDYCKNDIGVGKTRQYANYCPKCHKWNQLKIETKYNSNGQMKKIFVCSCGASYCTNCSISQGEDFIPSFLSKDYYYKDFIKKYAKMTHIRDD